MANPLISLFVHPVAVQYCTPPTVNIIDTGLSGHRLLCWQACLQRPPPVYVTTTRRSWRSFDDVTFQADFHASALCDEQLWTGLDGDGLVQLYDETIAALLDRQAPFRTKTCRRRPSNPWFDDECRTAKRTLRTLEHSARRAGSLSNTALPTVQVWRAERRRYFSLIREKRLTFWSRRIDEDRARPRRL